MATKRPAIPNPALQAARQRKGWSQGQLAQLVGTNTFTVCRWERGNAFPSPHFRRRLSEALEESIEALGLLHRDPTSHDAQVPSASDQSEAVFSGMPDYAKPAGGLVGREGLVDELRERLLAGEREIALCGLPGVGKTTLALALARDPALQRRFSGGVLWAGLGPSPDWQAVLGRWAKDLGVKTSGESIGTLGQRITEALPARPVLIVIDDVWRLEDALECRVGGEMCAYLVTTRFIPLAYQFTSQAPITVRELDDADSWQLFAAIAPQAAAREPDNARALVRSTGGLPLALRLIGNYVQTHALSLQPRRIRSAILRMLNKAIRLRLTEIRTHPALRPGSNFGDPISLHDIIHSSYARLSLPAQHILSALAVFPPKPNTFNEETAFAVCDLEPDVFLDALDLLADAGLIECCGDDRFSMHQVIADFAADLKDSDEPEKRLVRHMAQVAQSKQLDYRRLDDDVTNLLAALDLARRHDLLIEWRAIIIGLAKFFYAHNLGERIQADLRQAREEARIAGDTSDEIDALIQQGWLDLLRVSYKRAGIVLAEALSIARTANSLPKLMSALHVNGVYASRLNDYRRAEQFLLEGMALGEEVDEFGYARILLGLGNLYDNLDRLDEAEAFYERGLDIARHMSRGDMECTFLTGLGSISGRRGDLQRSIAISRQGLDIARSYGNQETICVLLSNLGEALIAAGMVEEGVDNLQSALRIALNCGYRARVIAFRATLDEVLKVGRETANGAAPAD